MGSHVAQCWVHEGTLLAPLGAEEPVCLSETCSHSPDTGRLAAHMRISLGNTGLAAEVMLLHPSMWVMKCGAAVPWQRKVQAQDQSSMARL